MDDILEGTAATLGEAGGELVKTGASLVGVALLAGLTLVGLGKMLEGFRD